MITTKKLLTNLCNLLVCACEGFRYGLTFLRAIFCSRAVLAGNGKENERDVVKTFCDYEPRTAILPLNCGSWVNQKHLQTRVQDLLSDDPQVSSKSNRGVGDLDGHAFRVRAGSATFPATSYNPVSPIPRCSRELRSVAR
jgi:hypothetical protein